VDDVSYVRASVGRSVQLWKNGGSGGPYAVWHHRSDGSRDEAGSVVWGSVHGKGTFGGEFGARHCNLWGLFGAGLRVLQRRDAVLFLNYSGQTCYYYYCYYYFHLGTIFAYLTVNFAYYYY